MTRNNFFHSLWRIASFLFLALVCCGQIYQSAHLHHFHQNNSVAFQVSAPPLNLAVDHSSAHQHPEEQSSPQDEHEHKYKKKADWNVARSTSITRTSFDAQALCSPAYSVPPIDFVKSTPWLQLPSCKKAQYVPFLIIRGPPQLA